MTWKTLRAQCRRESDYIITLLITNELSLLLTWALRKTRISPNQVTIASVVCEALCAVCYAFEHFLWGSLFYFIAHVLDCTDGNLARAKGKFSPLGRWLDFIGDRVGEVLIFLGLAIHFQSSGQTGPWVSLTLLCCLLLLLYYYLVDVGLSLGIAAPAANAASMTIKGVRVKWGLYEPVMYGLIILAPLGLVKIQVVLILVSVLLGLVYQLIKNYRHHRSLV